MFVEELGGAVWKLAVHAALSLLLACGDGSAGSRVEPSAAASGAGGTGSGGVPGSGGLAGSDSSGASGGSSGTAGSFGGTNPGLGPTAAGAGTSAPWVFDEGALHTYELTLDPESWELLQANAADEQYAEADLSAGDVRLSRVGLRFKGSLGTLVSCFDDAGMRTCSKLSMKLKFDEYLPSQRFHGLKRLNFNSMQWDNSLLRERLAYRVYREMGVVAPRAVHARLVVNGEDLGVFSLVEDIDGRFTDDRFRDGDGNLYKEQWPTDVDLSLVGERLETNEDVADHSGLMEFSAALGAAELGELPDVVASYLEVDEALAYLAANRSMNDWDGVATFYCDDDVACENHNFFLYQHETEVRFRLIPWDLDNTFATVTPLDDVAGLFDVPDDCSVRFPAFNRSVMAPACDPVIRGLIATDRNRYVAQLERLLTGPFDLERVDNWLSEWQAQLEPFVAEDEHGPGLEEFVKSVNNLRGNVSELRDRALEELDTLRP